MSSKRRALALPAPQLGDAEMEDIIKTGIVGEQTITVSDRDKAASQGLVGSYTNATLSTPIRTPRAPQEEDFIANEIRNARARTETQSALLGGANPDLIATPMASTPPPPHCHSKPNGHAFPAGRPACRSRLHTDPHATRQFTAEWSSRIVLGKANGRRGCGTD